MCCTTHEWCHCRKLERQCISVISFGSSTDILDCPIWLLCINVVAMEMLRTKLPPGEITISTQAVLVALRLMPTHTDMLGLDSTVLATNEFCILCHKMFGDSNSVASFPAAQLGNYPTEFESRNIL